MGAAVLGYRLAEQFRLKLTETRPALVPLTFEPRILERLAPLSGISTDAIATANGKSFREALLFTHRGLSGPAILQVSSYWQQAGGSEPIRVDLLPGTDARAWLASSRRSKATLATLLAGRLPKRFAQQWCDAHGYMAPLAQMGDVALEDAARTLTAWRIQPTGTL